LNLDKFDKIIIRNKEDLDRLLEWRDKHKDLVRCYSPVIKKGLIVSEVTGVTIYFQNNPIFTSYKVYLKNDEIMSFNVLRYSNGMYKVMRQNAAPWMPEKDIQDNIQSVVTTHSSYMAYMEHHTEYITKRTEMSNKIKKGKGGNKNKNRSIKIGRRVYEVSVPSSVLTEKRKYERHTETWTQRGHWRKIKSSGKRIWINAQIKGNKNKKPDSKSYHI